MLLYTPVIHRRIIDMFGNIILFYDMDNEIFSGLKVSWQKSLYNIILSMTIDIEYNKRLDRQRPCLKDELNGGSNNIVQSNKSVWRRW